MKQHIFGVLRNSFDKRKKKEQGKKKAEALPSFGCVPFYKCQRKKSLKPKSVANKRKIFPIQNNEPRKVALSFFFCIK